jgi:hypothetical protein
MSISITLLADNVGDQSVVVVFTLAGSFIVTVFICNLLGALFNKYRRWRRSNVSSN